ncbi:MAG: toll/interleukin-1 receptor domain-containing protein [Anaerolineae bacterium]|nr:toll/interleukin-1 receptor domain-containing protein [Anaerolineae bacterium]
MMNTRQLFISYRSTDAAEVDRIAHDLGALKHPDGITPRFRPWQDKRDVPPASPDWWEAIIDAISASEVFVFFISRASLESEVCRAELDYAYKRNRPIIPVVSSQWCYPVNSQLMRSPAVTRSITGISCRRGYKR